MRQVAQNAEVMTGQRIQRTEQLPGNHLDGRLDVSYRFMSCLDMS